MKFSLNPSHLSHARSTPTIELIAQIAVPMKPPPKHRPNLPSLPSPLGYPFPSHTLDATPTKNPRTFTLSQNQRHKLNTLST